MVDRSARIVWGCFPRFDGDPWFCRLLDDEGDDGYFAVELVDQVSSTQYYERNTAILCTEMRDTRGAAVRVTDFVPRYKHYGRHYRPIMVVRQVEALSGAPRVRLRMRPRAGYARAHPDITLGTSHIRYVGAGEVLRLTTDAPVTYLLQERPLVVDGRLTLILGPDESVADSIGGIAHQYLEKTRGYWVEWVRALGVPFEWQSAVIRAAITLKVSTFEDTGAVLAAMTTSVPEAPNTRRNWDYRYCWLRDAYFVVHALNRLGATMTMEGYLHYIINLVTGAGESHELQPLYGIGGEERLDESELTSLRGYRGMGPVRLGNDAYRQQQHDVYGAVVLAAAQSFFDERLAQPGDEALFRELELLGGHAYRLYQEPDAGIWEYRGFARVHTYSAVMCWAACDRLARIARRLDDDEARRRWRERADAMHERICERAWDGERGAFVDSFDGRELDASLLLLHELDFLDAADPRFVATVEAIEAELRCGDHIVRYAGADDFGEQENAFNVCTFWFIDALAVIGREREARDLFEKMLAHRSHLGLMSEDLDPATGELWGNFPQTYSMVGLINSAMRLSQSWESAF